MYFYHHIIIKYIYFESIHYIINLDIALSFNVFNEFDLMFLSNILLILINNIILFFKKIK